MPETENYTSSNRKLYVLLGILVLLVVIGVVTYPYAKNKFFAGDEEVNKNNIPTAELPSNFPADTPLAKALLVVHNFESSLPDGTKQSVRKWQSIEPPHFVKTSYTEYFAKNGWEITTSVSQPDLEILAAHKDGLFMSVSIRKMSEGNGALVEVVVR